MTHSTRSIRNMLVAGCALALLLPALLVIALPGTAHGQDAPAASAETATAPTGGAASASDSDCYFGLTGAKFTFNGCIWIPLMSWLGSWFLTIGGAFLTLAGTLFDTLIQYVILDFKGALDTLSITPAINTGWTIFRDFSNVLIIGIFTFIALSIILGLKEYGQKRMIANVLIIAVLMNFSLLFTKLIIEGSNFMATVIYKQMTGPGEKEVKLDIAQAFLKPMGITSVWNDTSLVTSQVGKSTGSAMQAFFFGLVGGILLLGAAVMLFYGCFLLASRAILFIFLMLTASIAFATYLLPSSISQGEYGWSAWWKSLLNNAVFAPLLMLMLAVSLVIISSAGEVAKIPLGQIIADPAKQLSGDGWAAIFIYIIGMGLLYVSFKVSSSFANSISGFNMASVLPAFGLAAGARLAALGGRHLIGRPALAISERLQDKSRTTDNMFARRMYDFGSQKVKGVAQRDFNALRTTLGGAIASNTGMKVDALAGKIVKGFEGSQKAYLKRAGDFAGRAKATDDQKKAGQEDARNKLTRGSMDEAYKAASAENRSRDADSVHAREQEKLEALFEKQDQEMKTLRGALEAAVEAGERGDAAAAGEASRLEAQIDTKRQQHLTAINEQTKKISDAKKATDQAKKQIENVETKLTDLAKKTGYNKWAFQNTGDIASEAVKKSLSQYLYASGLSKESREKLAKKAGKGAKETEQKHHFKEKYGDVFKEIAKDDHAEKPAPKAEKPAPKAEKPASEAHGDNEHH